MSFGSVIGISLVIGIVAIIGIAIVSYMSSLVRNAYEIKVEIRKDLDDGIKQVKSETIRQTKTARVELSSEIEKSRHGLLEDLKNRQAATEKALLEEIRKRDEYWRDENENLLSTIQELKDKIETLEGQPSLRARATLTVPPATKVKTEAPVEAATEAEEEEIVTSSSATEPKAHLSGMETSPPEALQLTAFEGTTIRRM